MADVSSPPEYANTTRGPVFCLCIWVYKNTGGWHRFARGYPLRIAPFGPGFFLRGRMRGDVRLLGLIEQSRILAVDPRHEFARIADPELPAGIERPGGRIGDLLGPRRIEAAVAPHDGHRGPAALRGKRIGDTRAGRRGLAVQLRGFRFDARRDRKSVV